MKMQYYATMHIDGPLTVAALRGFLSAHEPLIPDVASVKITGNTQLDPGVNIEVRWESHQ